MTSPHSHLRRLLAALPAQVQRGPSGRGQRRAPAGGEKEGAPWLPLSAPRSPPSASWPSLLPLALPLTWGFSFNKLIALKSVLKGTITSYRNAVPVANGKDQDPGAAWGSPLCALPVRKDGERAGGEFCHPGSTQTWGSPVNKGRHPRSSRRREEPGRVQPTKRCRQNIVPAAGGSVHILAD